MRPKVQNDKVQFNFGYKILFFVETNKVSTNVTKQCKNKKDKIQKII